MNKKDVKVGGVYVAKISGKLTKVRIARESPYGGWDATNTKTKRKVHIKSAQKLRYEVKAKKEPEDGFVVVMPVRQVAAE